MGSYIIIFLFGVFVGSMVSCAVLYTGQIYRSVVPESKRAKAPKY